MRTLHVLIALAAVVSAGAGAAAASLDAALGSLPPDVAAKAIVLCDGSAGLGLGLVADPQYGRATAIKVSGQPFTDALEIDVLKKTKQPWDVQVISPPTAAPIHRGDLLLMILHARCERAQSESGAGRIDANLQLAHDPWTGVASFSLRPGTSWQTQYSSKTADQDFAAGQLELALHLGSTSQTLQIGGLYVLDLGPGVDAHRLPYTAITYQGEEANAPWRAEAEARIERYRKADLSVRVNDARGQPVAGVAVHVRLRRHAYGFGTFLEAPTLLHNPDGDQYRAWIGKFFNRATCPLYWADWGWVNPTNRQQFLDLAAWAHGQDLQIRGHNLVWPSWRNLPTGLRALEHDPPALRRAVLDHITEVVTACRPYHFREYDVINEPRAEHDLMDLLGRDVMVDWFKAARAADPHPLLGLNDYQILSAGGDTETQQQFYLETIHYLLDHGAPLGVIGFQSHMSEDLTPPARVVAILDRFAALGLPLQATEFDVPIADEKAQADYTRDFLTAFFSEPATTAFTMWGFWEGQQWQPQAALIRKDWTLKPNGQAYLKLVTQSWWTDVRGVTGPDGTFRVRGFLGDYDLTITSHGSTTLQTTRCSLTSGGSQVVLSIGS